MNEQDNLVKKQLTRLQTHVNEWLGIGLLLWLSGLLPKGILVEVTGQPFAAIGGVLAIAMVDIAYLVWKLKKSLIQAEITPSLASEKAAQNS